MLFIRNGFDQTAQDFSNDAKRIWSAFDQLNYVESVEEKSFEIIGESSGFENYSDKKYRFTFKNFK